jgi:hypothetical protein
VATPSNRFGGIQGVATATASPLGKSSTSSLIQVTLAIGPGIVFPAVDADVKPPMILVYAEFRGLHGGHEIEDARSPDGALLSA